MYRERVCGLSAARSAWRYVIIHTDPGNGRSIPMRWRNRKAREGRMRKKFINNIRMTRPVFIDG
jgi:hypothetical protein